MVSPQLSPRAPRPRNWARRSCSVRRPRRPAHRDALANGQATTALTRAFTGRTARGIANRFLREHSADAPSAYPEVHHLTAPVRAAARQRGDADGFHLWAGQAYNLSKPIPAGELVVQLAEQAQAALSAATRRLESPG